MCLPHTDRFYSLMESGGVCVYVWGGGFSTVWVCVNAEDTDLLCCVYM